MCVKGNMWVRTITSASISIWLSSMSYQFSIPPSLHHSWILTSNPAIGSLRSDNIKWSHSFTPVDTLSLLWGLLTLFFLKLNVLASPHPQFQLWINVLLGFEWFWPICFLETYFIPGTVLDSENISMNKIHNVHELVGLTFGRMGWEWVAWKRKYAIKNNTNRILKGARIDGRRV